MARVRIFEVAEGDEQEAPAFVEAVGRFRSGRQDERGNPMSLDEWRVTTGDPAVAERIAEMFGGVPAPWDTQGEEVLEVETEAASVEIVLDLEDVGTSMALKSSDFKTIRECDGVQQSEEFGCADCVCPSSLPDRKLAARNGTGCKPDIKLAFTLAEAPELGRFRYFSGSWTLLEKLDPVLDKLEALGGPGLVRFALRRHSFTAKDGTPVSYVVPQLTVLGAAG